jgi:DNA-binding beta-propeller fold protein YncE
MSGIAPKTTFVSHRGSLPVLPVLRRVPVILAATASLCAVLTLLCWSSASPALAHETHVFEQPIGAQGPGAGQFEAPAGVAVNDTTGDVYIVDRGNERIDEFEANGTFIRAWGWGVVEGIGKREELQTCTILTGCGPGVAGTEAGQLDAPEAIAVDDSPSASDPSKEDVYVTNTAENVVEKFSASGAYLGQISSGVGGTPFGGLLGVAVSPGGALWIYAEKTGRPVGGENAEIDSYTDAEPNHLVERESHASQAGGEAWPGLAVDTAGDFYVGHFGNRSVAKLNSLGEVIAEEVTGRGSTAVAVDPSDNDVYVNVGTEVEVYNSGLARIDVFESAHPVSGSGIAVNSASGAVYVAGSASDDVDVFAASTLPDVTTEAPTGVTPTTALLHGTVNPDGIEVSSCEFEWGTEPGVYPRAAACTTRPGSGAAPVAVSAEATGLTPNTTYHYRLAASNATDKRASSHGQEESFSTAGPPEVDAESSASVGSTNVTLEAMLDPDGLATTYHFEYGPTGSYGTSIPVPDGELSATFARQAVSVPVTGLKPSTIYHYRVVASNEAGGPVAGFDQTFTTLPPALIEGTFVIDVTADSATLQGDVNPLGTGTQVYAEYGPCATTATCAASGYEKSTPTESAGSGASPAAIKPLHVAGLTARTAYHFRLIAENALTKTEGKPIAGEEVAFITDGTGEFTLPDGRQWELVSPPDKHGASIEPLGEGHVTQAAVGGEAVTYATTAPTESEPQGYSNLAQIVSTRDSGGGWSSHDVTPPHGAATGPAFQGEYNLFSPDLSLAVVQPFGVFTPCTSEGVRQPCLSEDATEQTASRYSTSSGTYAPLVTHPGDDTAKPFEPFGKQNGIAESNCPFGTTDRKICGPGFVGASLDLRHIVLSSTVALTNVPVPPGEEELYEWNEGAPPSEQLKLVSVAAPETPGDPEKAATGGPELGFENRVVRNAVSADGSRVIWTETTPNSGEHLYLRDVATGETVQLDAPQGGSESPGDGEQARFQLASSDGSRIFFTDRQPLTGNSGARAANSNVSPLEDLYECEVIVQGGSVKCLLSDVTPLGAGGEHADVQGHVLGASEQGCDVGSSAECNVYFVANGALTQGEGAVAGDCVGTGRPVNASCNLYVAHLDGSGWQTRLVAVLSMEDFPDWVQNSNANELQEMTSRVSPDGHWLAFMSQRGLTGYDTRDATSGTPDEEVYLYRAQTPTQPPGLACASCDPTGARPAGEPFEDMTLGGDGSPKTWSSQSIAGEVPTWTSFADGGFARYQPRYLSDTGRLFFDSPDALVPLDVNGTGDVYEYEPEHVPAGSPRACGPASTDGSDVFKPAHTFSVDGVSGEEPPGCVALISSGRASEESLFLDASESGGDVFFLTAERLVPEDFDTSYDVYDTHECSSVAPCPAPGSESPPPCATADSCRAAPTPQPQIFGAGPTETLVSTGNLAATQAKPAAKPLTRAQELADALRACRKGKSKKKRTACEKTAHKKYGLPKGKKSNRRGK